MGAMVTLPQANQLPRIQSASGADYQITPEDAEIVVRMGVFEGGDAAFTLWALAQRWVLFRDIAVAKAKRAGVLDPRYKLSFKGLMEAFSQPINPAWRRDGEFCAADGKYYGDPPCAETLLLRREYAAFTPLAEIYTNPRYRGNFETSVAWLYARVPNPVPGAVNFSAESVAKGYMARNPDAVEVARSPEDTCPTCNVFLTEGAAKKWPSNYVWLRGPDGRTIGTAAQNSLMRGLWSGLTSWWYLRRG